MCECVCVRESVCECVCERESVCVCVCVDQWFHVHSVSVVLKIFLIDCCRRAGSSIY